MITEGGAAIPLETTRRAFRNQEQSKQRSAITFFSVFVFKFYVWFDFRSKYEEKPKIDSLTYYKTIARVYFT